MADMLSQEEIDALLKGTSNESDTESKELFLTEEEKDALGEIGNISMGTAATTLFTLLGQKVTITTPRVSQTTIKGLSEYYESPCVAVFIRYKEGIEGFNLLVLNEKDVKIITDLMMGGDGTNISNELTELHLSAIGEAMNQMIGSASTSLSEIFTSKIDILPPNAYHVDFNDEQNYDELSIAKDDTLIRIAFSMKVGDLIDSEIMQIIPIEYAKQLVKPLLYGQSNNVEQKNSKNTDNKNKTTTRNDEINDTMVETEDNISINNNQQVNRPAKPINVKSLQFESFDEDINQSSGHNDISLIRDVPLNVTVELGRSVKRISDILEFGPGTVVELDKLVGEPLDILVNGKSIARGEVVVVDENYGIRITDIVSSKKRMNKI